MKIALSLEVTDEQRNALAKKIAGKEIKRLATREETRAYVEGCIGALASEPTSPSTTRVSGHTATEEEVVAKLRAEGKSEGYIKGWIDVGRKTH